MPDTSPQPLTRKDLFNRLGSLQRHRNAEAATHSRHKPIALLWAIARMAKGAHGPIPWAEFDAGVEPLLTEYGLPQSRSTPENPFWHLRTSGIWEVHGSVELTGPSPRLFRDAGATAGFTREAAELLQDRPTQVEAILRLRDRYLPEVEPAALLDRLGLPDTPPAETSPDRATGPAPRRESTTSAVVRDTAVVARLKELHDHRCQVCGLQLRRRGNPYSEGAHIRGLGQPHHGPDELHNLLCLCANHHVLFDGLEIYIDLEGLVRETHGDQVVGELRRHPGHPIDQAHIAYHRDLCARQPAVS